MLSTMITRRAVHVPRTPLAVSTIFGSSQFRLNSTKLSFPRESNKSKAHFLCQEVNKSAAFSSSARPRPSPQPVIPNLYQVTLLKGLSHHDEAVAIAEVFKCVDSGRWRPFKFSTARWGANHIVISLTAILERPSLLKDLEKITHVQSVEMQPFSDPSSAPNCLQCADEKEYVVALQPGMSIEQVGDMMFDVEAKFGQYISEEHLNFDLGIKDHFELGQTCMVVRARTIPPLLLEDLQSMDVSRSHVNTWQLAVY